MGSFKYACEAIMLGLEPLATCTDQERCFGGGGGGGVQLKQRFSLVITLILQKVDVYGGSSSVREQNAIYMAI